MDKSSYGRRDRLLKEKEHDVYRARVKLSDPALCPECGAAYVKGRWVWGEVPEEASRITCPACRRIADRLPAGWIELQGGFYSSHHDEIINLVQHVESREKSHHPMERIITIKEWRDKALITTTGIHIARGIGSALSRAYNGELNVRYLDEENSIQVRWSR